MHDPPDLAALPGDAQEVSRCLRQLSKRSRDVEDAGRRESQPVVRQAPPRGVVPSWLRPWGSGIPTAPARHAGPARAPARRMVRSTETSCAGTAPPSRCRFRAYSHTAKVP